MKKIITIAAVVLRLAFKSGAAWGLLALTTLTACFMFFAASSDNILVDELHIRIKYALYAFSILLNIALIYFSCISLRKDIDDRRFHTIAAAPVHRAQIWLGKFTGMLIFGIIVFSTASAAVALSTAVFILKWHDKEEVSKLKENFFSTYYVCRPDIDELEKEVMAEYRQKLKILIKQQQKDREEEIRAGTYEHDAEGEGWRSRKYLLDEIRKGKQVIAPGTVKTWKFKWYPDEVRGEYILLRFKFYSNRRRKKVHGEWSLPGTDWKTEFSGYPFIENEIKIPAKYVRDSKQLSLSYKELDSTYVIFPLYRNGIVLLFNSGGIAENYLYLIFFDVLHMATLIALALAFSSLFSYSVAVFATTAAYITGAFSPFFETVVKNLSFHDQTFINTMFSRIIEFGIYLTEGTQPFPVNGIFADGLSIPIGEILQSSITGYILYLAALIGIGIYAITVKEIDKILQR